MTYDKVEVPYLEIVLSQNGAVGPNSNAMGSFGGWGKSNLVLQNTLLMESEKLNEEGCWTTTGVEVDGF